MKSIFSDILYLRAIVAILAMALFLATAGKYYLVSGIKSKDAEIKQLQHDIKVIGQGVCE